MTIGIDARLIAETGVGRYIRNLIRTVAAIDQTNTYIVYLRKNQFEAFTLPNRRWQKRLAEVPWHTVREQIAMPAIFARDTLDLVHIPYHNPPIFYQGAMVVTIHDLTILHFNTGKATNLPLPLYMLKRLGYWLELEVGLRRAKRIIAVSEATKREIIDHFHIPAEKIVVTYEGVDPNIRKPDRRESRRLIPEPYFLYVGNAYPHKNIEMLLRGFARFIADTDGKSETKLVLVGNADPFYRRLQEAVKSMELSGSVRFFGPANDTELINLYSHAVAFIFPSLMEGFGLPALEALSLGCHVLASDIAIFHEILGPYVTYFDAGDVKSIATALTNALGGGVKTMTESQKFVAAYSWQRMARETLDIYERSARL